MLMLEMFRFWWSWWSILWRRRLRLSGIAWTWISFFASKCARFTTCWRWYERDTTGKSNFIKIQKVKRKKIKVAFFAEVELCWTKLNAFQLQTIKKNYKEKFHYLFKRSKTTLCCDIATAFKKSVSDRPLAKIHQQTNNDMKMEKDFDAETSEIGYIIREIGGKRQKDDIFSTLLKWRMSFLKGGFALFVG